MLLYYGWNWLTVNMRWDHAIEFLRIEIIHVRITIV